VLASDHTPRQGTIQAQGGAEARKLPLTAEEILESAMLVYLKGLGILAADHTPPS